ncbi:MAG: hypothetical protein GY749_17070 [Desulfobacteraceae bacterium]|nr:hypothetical protein [Desulfobacteraceae bacterium]
MKPAKSDHRHIVLDQETNIQAIDIVIQFDKNLLEPEEVTLIGGILEDWEDNVQVIADAEGRLAVKIFGTDEINGAGEVAFVTFNVTGPLESTSALSFTKFEVNESPVSGGFSVDDTVTPRVEVRIVKPVIGDINGDRIVDIRDTILALKVLSGADTGNIHVYPAADVNGDRIIGIHEVIYGLQIIPGIRSQAAI